MDAKKAVLFLRMWATIKRKQLLEVLLPRKGRNYTPFVILCAPRTGSTWLHTSLNSHPNIHSLGESWKSSFDEGRAFETTIQDQIFGVRAKHIQAVGLKIFYEDLLGQKYGAFVHLLLKTSALKIIHLRRRDLRAMQLSTLRARASGVWSTTKQYLDKEGRPPKDEEYKRFRRAYLHISNTVDQVTEGSEVFHIYYEEMVTDYSKILHDLLLFLEVKPRRLFSLLKKQS